MQELIEWSNFYLIAGSAAGALVGLQFVVITLIGERPPVRAAEAGSAFATPSIVHLGVVLVLSALICAPWKSIAPITVLLGVAGVGGMAYVIIVAWRMHVQTTYRPVFYDWFFHVLLPFAAYASLLLSAFAASSYTREALFGVGAATLLLLYVGIHNAWDAVTYHLLVKREKKHGDERR